MDFLQLPITIYSITPYSDTISKARALIFYKGVNRNGGYIDDQFADILLSTAPYAPIKGIYRDGDFTDHGEERSEGRIYGVVAAEPNTSWETKIDDDGIERTYAAVDVLLYTALYKEAKEIVGKSLSMELYRKSISGKFVYVDGRRVFQYSKGAFLGLQALGDRVEPAFEGAAFYSLNTKLESAADGLKEAIDKYSLVLDELQKEENNKSMSDFIFQLSFDEIQGKLMAALNPRVEDGHQICTKFLVKTYDEYAVYFDDEDQKCYRATYTINEDEVVLGDAEEVFIVDVTKSEKDVLDALKANYTLEQVNETVTNFENLQNLNSEISSKNVELEQQIATLTMTAEQTSQELEGKNTELATLQASINALTEENTALSAFKKSVIDQQKVNVIDSYAALLDGEILAKYRAADVFEKYDVEELDKELAYELKKSNSALFSKADQTEEPGGFPKDVTTGSSLTDVLNQYKK